jgi:hypothetical protein
LSERRTLNSRQCSLNQKIKILTLLWLPVPWRKDLQVATNILFFFEVDHFEDRCGMEAGIAPYQVVFNGMQKAEWLWKTILEVLSFP